MTSITVAEKQFGWIYCSSHGLSPISSSCKIYNVTTTLARICVCSPSPDPSLGVGIQNKSWVISSLGIHHCQSPRLTLEWQVGRWKIQQISSANLFQHLPGTSQEADFAFSPIICLKVMMQDVDSSDKVPVHNFLKFSPTVRHDSIWQAMCWKYLRLFEKGLGTRVFVNTLSHF